MSTCFACKKPRSGCGLMWITAKDRDFHKACFVCCVCKNSLAGQQHYLQEDSYYCISDYQKRWGVKCTGCGLYLDGTYTTVGDSSFHDECFKCCVCCKSLAGTRHHTRDGSYYCIPDYQKKWGVKCHTCKEYLNGEYRTAGGLSFHEQCFKCEWCENQIDRYFLSADGKDILCSSCYNHTKESSTLTRKPSPMSSFQNDQRTTKRETNTEKLDVLSMKLLYKENPIVRQSDMASTSSSSRLDESTLRTKKPGKLDESKFSLFENMLQKTPQNPSSLQALKRTSVLVSPPVTPTSPTTFSQDKGCENETVTSASSRQSSVTSDCVICFDKQVDNIFIPCGHASLCNECAEEYKKSKGSNLECLICRTPSTGIFKIYTP